MHRLKRLIVPILIVCIILSFAVPASADATKLKVYYSGPQGSLPTALGLAEDFELVSSPQGADVLVFNGPITDPQAAAAQVQAGAGAVILLTPEMQAAELAPLLGEGITLTPAKEPLSLAPEPGAKDLLLDQIIWTSSPQVRERMTMTGADVSALVRGYETGEPVLASRTLGQGQVFVFTAQIGTEINPQIQQWAYYNYWIYHMVMRAGGREPLSFGKYPGSPVPHAAGRAVLLSICALMIVLSFTAFFFVRRYSLRHPEALDAIVSNRAEYQEHQASTDWEEVGFHRPLGGFMLALMLGFIFFIPMIIYQALILPVYILPSAQALGIWGRVTQFFNVLWLLFDMGTSAAFIKYFSEYRVHDPRTGVKFGQVFVWWQLLSGAFQVAIVTVIASVILPETPYALYAWSIIIHTMVQLPGFYLLYRYSLPANQRFDYAQIIDLGKELVLPMLVQPIFVTLLFMWGKNNPIFGASMGGLIGLGVAAYFVEVLTFVLGFFLNKRLGFSNKILFMAHFDWGIVKKAFRFGVFEMLGSVAWAAGQAMEIVVTQSRLVNYAEIWGNWGLAQNFIFAFNVVAALYNNAMPSISEAISNGYRKLSQYYSVMMYKYGGIFSAFLGAILLATTDRFILGASGPEFSRAAVYAIPLIIWGAFQYPSWVGDQVQLGSNRPYLKTVLVLGEQIIRITLAFILVEKLQVTGLIVAYFVGLLTKDLVGYFVNHKLCFPQRFYFWQSLGAPLLAGGAHYLILRWVTGLIWAGDQVTSIIIFFIGLLPSYPLFAFLYGLAGGWDDATLAELKKGAALSGIMRPLSWLFWKATELGTRISPLHNRFPISIRGEAMLEAERLTGERVKLT